MSFGCFRHVSETDTGTVAVNRFIAPPGPALADLIHEIKIMRTNNYKKHCKLCDIVTAENSSKLFLALSPRLVAKDVSMFPRNPCDKPA